VDAAGDEAAEIISACKEAGKTSTECQTLGKAIFKKFGGNGDRFNKKIKKQATKDAASWISDCLESAKTTVAEDSCKAKAKKKIEDVAGETLDAKTYEQKKKEGGADVAVDRMGACIKEQKLAGAANLDAAKKACFEDAKAKFQKCGNKKHEFKREALNMLLKKAARIFVECQDADVAATADTCIAEAKTKFLDNNGGKAAWERFEKVVLKMAKFLKEGTPTERKPTKTAVVDAVVDVEGGAAVFCDAVKGKEAQGKYLAAIAKFAKVDADKVKLTTCGDTALVVEEATRRLRDAQGRRLAASSCETSVEVQASSSDDAATIADAMGTAGTTELNKELATSGMTATGDVAASRDFTETPVSSAVSTGADASGPAGQKAAVKTDAAPRTAPSMLIAAACVVAALLR